MMAPEDLTDDALAVLVREACERQVAQQAGVRPPAWTSFGGEGHGSFAPGAVGLVNPSLTITALAERTMDRFLSSRS